MRYRRYSLGLWVAALIVLATFVAEPRATGQFAGDVFRTVGAIGGEIVTQLTSEDDPAASIESGTDQ